MTPYAEHGGRFTRKVVGAVVGFIALVAFVVVGSVLDRSTVVAGPDGSSYVTTGNGTAALFELLAASDRSPVRLRSPIEAATLAGVGSLMVIEPGLATYQPSEVAALESWTSDGGRLVVVGRPPGAMDPLTAEASERWTSAAVETEPTFLPEGLRSESRRFGAYDPTDSAASWVSGPGGRIAEVLPLGSGWVVLVADLGRVSNDGIDRADNARIALTLIGSGPVAFDEVRHGFEDGSGIVAAAPGNWEAALPLLGLALVAGLVTYGRRFGPPEPTQRTMIPSRAEFIDSLGDALAATGRLGEVAHPIRDAAQRLIRSRARSDQPEDLSRAARSLGLDESEFDAAYDNSEDTVFTAQRALSKLHRKEPRHD